MPSNTVNNGITRNAMFYSEEDFNMECEILEGYLEEDLNQSVIVYEVDRTRTQTDVTYKESKNKIRFKPPREIPCMYEIKSSETRSYDSKTANGVYSIIGNMTLYVMPSILRKYHCDIRRGDYIGVKIDEGKTVYFVVSNDGKVNWANETFVGAYKPAWRRLDCAPATLEEFSGQ